MRSEAVKPKSSYAPRGPEMAAPKGYPAMDTRQQGYPPEMAAAPPGAYSGMAGNSPYGMEFGYGMYGPAYGYTPQAYGFGGEDPMSPAQAGYPQDGGWGG